MYIIVYTYMAPYIVNMQKLKLWENTYIRTYVHTDGRTDRQTARQPGSQADRQTYIDRCIGEQHLNNRIPCWQGPCFFNPCPWGSFPLERQESGAKGQGLLSCRTVPARTWWSHGILAPLSRCTSPSIHLLLKGLENRFVMAKKTSTGTERGRQGV